MTPVTPDTSQSASVAASLAWSPATSNISPASSQSTLTPTFNRLALARGQGHPCKMLQQPSYDDYPMDRTKAEQNAWVRCKSAEQWRYNKLMSPSAEAYREAENIHASKFHYEKKKGQDKKHAAAGKAADLVDDEDGSDAIEVEKATTKDGALKKNHFRCIHEKCRSHKICKIFKKNQKQ